MRKLVLCLFVVGILSPVVNAAEIKFIIPDEKLPRVVDAMKGMFPIPLDGEGQPMFADGPWAKEVVRRWIIQTVRRYEARKAMDAAAAAVQPDDTIAQ